jgi:hypothetical protein
MERAVDHLVGTAVGRFLAENPTAGGCTLVLEVEDKSVAGVPNGVAAPPGTRPLRVVPARATGAAGTPPAT